jgi:hypothetical protein
LPIAATGTTPKGDWITEALIFQAPNAHAEGSAARTQPRAATGTGRANWRARAILQAALPNPDLICGACDNPGDIPVFNFKDSFKSHGRECRRH